MHDYPKTWMDLHDYLFPAWQELNDRHGSFADAPWEPGDHFDQTMKPIFEFDREAVLGIKRWLQTGVFPNMSSAATRIAWIHVDCARGLCRQLPKLLAGQKLPGQTIQELLCWLLLDAYADTTRNALDYLRTDILGGKV